jgi:hypothetical protein
VLRARATSHDGRALRSAGGPMDGMDGVDGMDSMDGMDPEGEARQVLRAD